MSTGDVQYGTIFNPGDRVETHPATDSWMMGDRFGTVKTVGRKYVHVVMDKSGAVRKFAPNNLQADNRSL